MKTINLVDGTSNTEVDEVIFSKESRLTRFDPDDLDRVDNYFFIATSQNEYIRLQDCEIDNLIEALKLFTVKS